MIKACPESSGTCLSHPSREEYFPLRIWNTTKSSSAESCLSDESRYSCFRPYMCLKRFECTDCCNSRCPAGEKLAPRLEYRIFFPGIVKVFQLISERSWVVWCLPARVNRFWNQKTLNFLEVVGQDDSFPLIVRFRFDKPGVLFTMLFWNFFTIEISLF